MANEIQIALQLSTSKSGRSIAWQFQVNATQTGPGKYDDVLTATTSWTQLTLTDVAPGWMAIKNDDATNFMEVSGAADGSGFKAKLLPGEFFPFRKNSSIYVKADTASVNYTVVALDA